MKRSFVEAAVACFILCLPLGAEAMSFDAIRKYAETHPVSRLDDVLEPLAKSFLHDRQGHVALIYSSLSAQRKSVDPEHPRLLFFTENMVGAVTGNPARPEDYERLEMIEQNPVTKVFEFHELRFDGGKPIPDANPSSCARCHGSDARPIWGSYPLWPGVFGGNAERFSNREETDFIRFREQMAGAEGKRYRLFEGKITADAVEQGPFQLGERLGRMNAERVAAKILRSPAYPLIRFALAGAFAECPDPGGFLPPALRENEEGRLGRTYESLAADTQRIKVADYEQRIARYNALNGTHLALSRYRLFSDLSGDSDGVVVAKLRYFLEGQRIDPGINMPDWSMSITPGGFSYTYSAGAAVLADMVPAAFMERLRKDTAGLSGRWSCEALRARSQEALAASRLEP